MHVEGRLNAILIRIVLAYAIMTLLWIYLTDMYEFSVISTLMRMQRASLLKGLLYVTVSSSLFYMLLRYYALQVNRSMAELRESEERYATLIENSRDGIFIQTGGRFAYLNRSACAMFGARSADDLLGSKVMEQYHPDYRDKVLERIRIINEERLPVSTTDEKCLRMDGTPFDVDLQAVPFSYRGENGALVFFRDITRRKQAENEARHERELVRQLLDSIPNPAFLISRDRRIKACNSAGRQLGVEVGSYCWCGLQKLTANSGERPTGWKSAESPNDGSKCRFCLSDEAIAKSITMKQDVESNGRTWEAWWSPVDEETYLHYAIDITSRKRAESELEKQSEFLSAILDCIEDGVVACDQDGILTRFNRVASRFLGIREAPLSPEKWAEYYGIFNPDGITRMQTENNPLFKALQGIGVTNQEMVIAPKNGQPLTVLATSRQLVNREGTKLGAVVTMHDISAIKKAQKALKESDELFRILATLAPVGVYLADMKGAYQYVNERWCEIAGIPQQEAYGSEWEKALHPEDRDMVVAACREIIESKGSMGLEYRFLSPDGEVRWVYGVATPYMDADGNERGFIGANIEITAHKKADEERRSLEDQLRQARKMESIGTLAGGVAHDFNNILTVIMGACTMLNLKIGSNDELEPFVTQIYESSERAAKLTQSLLAFSRKQNIKPRLIDLNDIVSSFKVFLERIIGEDVPLETAMSSASLPVFVDRGQIEQVIMNLVVNARDAMPDGGRLRIATSLVVIDDLTAGRVWLRNGTYALITVSDSGIGMSREIQSRIFEPFFTTKERGRGTGLGLSMAYGIVKQHDGVIDVCSEPGNGTTFSVYLPIRQSLPNEASGDKERNFAAGNETILLVEDDEDVRIINKNILSSVGYKVLAAANGEEALHIFERNQGAISLVILDVIMPGMNGKELEERLQLICPEVKVLFASGYSDEHLLKKGVVPEHVNFISKPFAPHIFLCKVRDIIDN